MPTGYTAGIKEGIAFKDFVLQCARGFGALVTLRDEPMSSEIPNEIKPSTWGKEQLDKAEIELKKIQTLSLEEAGEKSKEDFYNAKDLRLKRIDESNELKIKYLNMLQKVEDWQPPTSEHINLKNFMIKQIEDSIAFDCNTSYYEEPKLLTASEWLDKKVNEYIKDISYHTKANLEEIYRCKQRTDWIKSLKQSLENKCL